MKRLDEAGKVAAHLIRRLERLKLTHIRHGARADAAIKQIAWLRKELDTIQRIASGNVLLGRGE
jgi:hypothetical protein